jgi:zinc transporter 2
MCKLLIVSTICFIFMGGELVGGLLSGSLAIMTDAAHMLSDVAGFMISYFAIYLSNRPASS